MQNKFKYARNENWKVVIIISSEVYRFSTKFSQEKFTLKALKYDWKRKFNAGTVRSGNWESSENIAVLSNYGVCIKAQYERIHEQF